MLRKIKGKRGGLDWKAGKWKERTQQQSKETAKETKRRQWERDEHRQRLCISSRRLRGSDQCLIITSTLTACWDSSAPSCILLPLLHWHNPSSRGATPAGAQVALANSVSVRLNVKSCVCFRLSTTFNVMLIQFIFNEGTVSAYREAKEISGLLHSGKSIAHLFILLLELCV